MIRCRTTVAVTPITPGFPPVVPPGLPLVAPRALPPVAKKNRQCHFPAEVGFTLLELLVVVVIIGLLAGYVGPRYFEQVGRSEIRVAKAQIDAFEKALEQYRLDVGRFPSTEEGLAVLNRAPGGETKWRGPYLKKDVPPDPWGSPYQYRAPGSKGDYEIVSFGRDRRTGGSGEDADISSH